MTTAVHLPPPRIVSLATAVPSHRLSQTEAVEFFYRFFDVRPGQRKRLKNIYLNAEIDTRYTTAPVHWYEQAQDFEQKNNLYVDNAVSLLRKVAVESNRDRRRENFLEVPLKAQNVLLRAVERRLVVRLPIDRGDVVTEHWNAAIRGKVGAEIFEVHVHPARLIELPRKGGVDCGGAAFFAVSVATLVAKKPVQAKGFRPVRRTRVPVEAPFIVVVRAEVRAEVETVRRHRLLAHQIDRARKGIAPVEEAGRPLEDLDALHVIELIKGRLRLCRSVGKHEPARQ